MDRVYFVKDFFINKIKQKLNILSLIIQEKTSLALFDPRFLKLYCFLILINYQSGLIPFQVSSFDSNYFSNEKVL